VVVSRAEPNLEGECSGGEMAGMSRLESQAANCLMLLRVTCGEKGKLRHGAMRENACFMQTPPHPRTRPFLANT